MRDVLRIVQEHERDPERAQQILGHAAAFGLPRIALAEFAPMADEHQERNAIELRTGDNPVDRREEAVVLHQHGRPRPGQVRAGRDTHALFFLRQPDENHVRIVLSHADEVHEPRLG